MIYFETEQTNRVLFNYDKKWNTFKENKKKTSYKHKIIQFF